MNESFVYTGRELEAMSFAVNYHRWVLRVFKPYLGAHLVEVGAGVGSFSELILEEHPCQTLSLVEPSAEMCRQLAARVPHMPSRTRVETYNATFTEVAARIRDVRPPDSILYVNVLEHIADDEAELEAVRRTLAPRGRVLIFAPALRWLYGRFDERIGHFRRYTRAELEQKTARAGFAIIESGYMDFLGIAPWWVKYRLLKSDTMERGAVEFYDRFVVPVARGIESLIRPRIGKNLFLIGEKASH